MSLHYFAACYSPVLPRWELLVVSWTAAEQAEVKRMADDLGPPAGCTLLFGSFDAGLDVRQLKKLLRRLPAPDSVGYAVAVADFGRRVSPPGAPVEALHFDVRDGVLMPRSETRH